MYCASCGTENTENNTFCSNCGASLTPAVEAEPVAADDIIEANTADDVIAADDIKED